MPLLSTVPPETIPSPGEKRPPITSPVLWELASVQETGDSSLANSIDNLLDPPTSPPRAVYKEGTKPGVSGWGQGSG